MMTVSRGTKSSNSKDGGGGLITAQTAVLGLSAFVTLHNYLKLTVWPVFIYWALALALAQHKQLYQLHGK